MDTNTKPPPCLHSVDSVLEILREGEAELRGMFRLGSNDAFLCALHRGSDVVQAVYKPVSGERPLWDFPAGTLAKREAAAFEVARILGWDFVPPTVFRDDGPLGPGSFQEFLDLDLAQNYFLLREEEPEMLRRAAAFDIVINNADRKAMHVLRDSSGRIWLIDHGVCFHREWKLRTVIWDYAEEPLPEDVMIVLKTFTQTEQKSLSPGRPALHTRLHDVLHPLLSTGEIRGMEIRAKTLWKAGKFPIPGPGISIPWPVWV
jgi:uncharacterized repeat protein (TIGR03843 family)